jgi:hypothetical protein
MIPNNMPFPVVGIAGGLNTGKGTVAAVFKHNGYMERNFADPLKRIVRDLFNVPTRVLWGPSENRTPLVRAMLQELGTDYARKYRPNIWIDKMEESLAAFAESGLRGYRGIVISDVRFKNEVDFIHEIGGTTILLTRPGNATHLPEVLATHSSETELACLPESYFKHILRNTGTREDLERSAGRIVKLLEVFSAGSR